MSDPMRDMERMQRNLLIGMAVLAVLFIVGVGVAFHVASVAADAYHECRLAGKAPDVCLTEKTP